VNEVVKLERHDAIAIVTVNSPPVNALSAAVRGGIFECMKSAIADPEVKAIVLTCDGRTFIAGADITEFGKPPKPPGLAEVLSAMENSPKRIPSWQAKTRESSCVARRCRKARRLIC